MACVFKTKRKKLEVSSSSYIMRMGSTREGQYRREEELKELFIPEWFLVCGTADAPAPHRRVDHHLALGCCGGYRVICVALFF